VTKVSDVLVEDQLREIDAGRCPDCHHRGFCIGPMALPSAQGANINIECGALSCRSRFAVAFYASQALFGTRIEKQSEGGLAWRSEPAIEH
jgi:hypothetical protein